MRNQIRLMEILQ